jgi:hypothetical protein
MSLPLPRPVGVASNDELLTLQVLKNAGAQEYEPRETSDEARIMEALSAQLPVGIELISASFTSAGSSIIPCSVTYVLSVQQEYLDRDLADRIEDMLASETLVIQRKKGENDSDTKNIDVRRFINTIKLEGEYIFVECGLTAAGSIRVQEILELLGLDETMLASAIRRTSVQWQDV